MTDFFLFFSEPDFYGDGKYGKRSETVGKTSGEICLH